MNGTLEDLPIDRNRARRYRVGTVASLEDIPATIQSCSPHYVLLLAVDATSIENDIIRAVARLLLDRGLASLCVWGPDCSRVHDQFDLERDPNETSDQVVMTTWHDDEPLSEAVWYFDFCAIPAADLELACTDWVAISVADNAWEQVMKTALVEGVFDNE